MTTAAFRNEVSQQMAALVRSDDPDASITFDSTLSSENRKYVHHLAEQFGLRHKSAGKGAGRCITVSRCEHKDKKRNQEGKVKSSNSSGFNRCD